MIPLDTSGDAARIQARIHASWSPQRRVEVAAELSSALRRTTAAGIRRRHPSWSAARVRHELLVRLYGRELVERAWGPPPRR